MRVIINSQEQSNELVAMEYVKLLKDKPASVLGLATGSTPLGLYSKLIEHYKNGAVSFKDVKTFNLDEYIGLSSEHEQSYRYFMNKNLFEHIDIDLKNTNVPSGLGADEKACEDYERSLIEAGEMDIQLLGLGTNGHIGFNEPLTPFDSVTRIVKLADATREANKRFFSSIDEVPTHAITMGISSIMRARKIILMVFGAAKAEVVKQVVMGKPTIAVPGSLLQLHNNLDIYLDFEAASRLG